MNQEKLMKYGEYKTLNCNEFICRENDMGHSAFVLVEGCADVILNSLAENSNIIGQLEPGDIFGEMSILEGKNRSASVIVSSEKAVVCEIPEKNFYVLMAQEPSIEFSILKSLHMRMDNMLTELEPFDKAFVDCYRSEETFAAIEHLSEEEVNKFQTLDEKYSLGLLKYLSLSLDNLNKKWIEVNR